MESQEAQQAWFKRQQRARRVTGYAAAQRKLAKPATEGAKPPERDDKKWMKDMLDAAMTELQREFRKRLKNSPESAGRLVTEVNRLVQEQCR